MKLAPGSTRYGKFTVVNPYTLAASNADSTPTITVERNGASVAPSVTVTNPATGEYRYSYTVDGSYVADDTITETISVTVAGITQKPVQSYTIDGKVYGGAKLASDGLDSISTAAPTGLASNFREMLVQTWRRFFKKSTLDATSLKTYADNGTTVVTTQTVSDDGTTQTQGTGFGRLDQRIGAKDRAALLTPPFDLPLRHSATPVISSITTYDGGYYGGVMIRYKAFVISSDDLEPGASVRLYVDGDDAGLCVVRDDGTVLFMQVVLPLGWTNLSIRQELDGTVSERSPDFRVRVNSAENVGVSLPAPKIVVNGGALGDTFTNWPVTVTITSEAPGPIYYCVDGTGYSQPTIEYKGPFRLYQTTVVKAKVKFNRVRSYTPVESRVVRRTIRIVR